MAAKGTPWFKLYSQLRSHPKLEDLAAALKLPKAHALGHLVMLWCWVTDYSEDGDLMGVDTPRIERAAGWEGSPGALVRALAALRWLDGKSGSYSVHGWLKYAESYKRAKDKQNQRGKSQPSPDTGMGLSRDSIVPVSLSGEERRREERRGHDGSGEDRTLDALDDLGDPL